MNGRGRAFGLVLAVTLVAAPPVARAAVVAAPGYVVRTIPTPDTVQGGVVRRGGTILVGQGPTFTANAQRIIRFAEGGTPTTLATGFSSLGGFDIDAAGTLYVVDNGSCLGPLPGATTGSTVYAIPDAVSRADQVTAETQAVLPANSIPCAADVLVAPTGAVLVSDAEGPGAGRVLTVSSAATPLVAGLDYASGLAIARDTLFVANVTSSFVDMVLEYGLDGAGKGTLATNLPGAFGVAVDADGDVLVSGEYSATCDGRLLAVAPDGTVGERARGFCSSTDVYFDGARNETLVLDVGAKSIAAICRDRDGNGVCDADQPCVGPATITRAALRLGKLTAAPGHATLAFRGEMMLPAQPPLDPPARGARLLVTDGAGSILYDVQLPGGTLRRGGTGWKHRRHGWVYRGDRKRGGVVRLTIETDARIPGLVRFRAVATKGAFTVTPGDLPLRATMVLDADGQCGETAFMPSACARKHESMLRCAG
ncbi:MAG TPA: hypothetical protein VKW76_06025 [Candidatus Binatia bacterium]|nr:hypothetical protein [Candidatus Binatia bacterium]